MDLQKEKIIRACVLTISGIGSQRLRHLIARYGSAQAAWDCMKEEHALIDTDSWLTQFFLMRKRINPQKIEQNLKKEGILLVAREEDNYPFLLAECPDAPPLLFYKGKLQSRQKGIAVVGSRKATPYGKAAASFLAKEIATTHYVVVSGLARGIDSAAHKGALEVGGTTWAFLAGGLDKIYPPENAKLALEIIDNGALISEYPPGMPSEPGQFPARNRLISGSSRGVVVVEAEAKSGALITVDFALEQGREVFSVPGPIFSPMSKGTHQLLRMGAKLVESKEDIIIELRSIDQSQPDKKERHKVNPCRDPALSISDNLCEQEILRFLSDVPVHIDRLTALCCFSPQEIALSLLEMQLSNRVIQLPGQHYVLQR